MYRGWAGVREVRRHELTDAEWQKIAPMLPVNGRPGEVRVQQTVDWVME